MADHYNETSLAEVWGSRGPEAILAEQLRNWRTARGWSQQDVALRMSKNFGYGWHQTTVARIEGQARPVRLNEAVALAMLFDVDLGQVLKPPQVTIEEIDSLRRREADLRAREEQLAAMRDHVARALARAHEEMAVVERTHRDTMVELEHIRGLIYGSGSVGSGFANIARLCGQLHGDAYVEVYQPEVEPAKETTQDQT
ncbi:helix-turn-helix domain-containing protein [Micromonospora sp. NPDC048930]|uniref:helix-turn-helix domain-containing protein n=1 Tax=Micromonospora sp. NPDC048930 TaxID=3364261 RepID=UPI00372251AB